MRKFTITDKVVRRFWKFTDRRGDNECWIWNGVVNWLGYGRLLVEYKSTQAHRISWAIHHGEIPDGLHVLHTCNNRQCVNPAHLFLGTQSENTAQAYHDGNLHSMKGEAHPRAKLTNEKVIQIRNSSDTAAQLAQQYGVNKATIRDILSGRRWKHIT